MILLKIGNDGELQWNHQDVLSFSKLYDEGWHTEDTEKAKLLQLVWEAGYSAAIDRINISNERTMLLFGAVGGHA